MKPIYKSKTFWANIVAVIAPIILPPLIANPATYVSVVGVINILLRAITKDEVSIPLVKPTPEVK